LKIIDGHIHIGKWSRFYAGYKSSVKEAVRVLKKFNISEAVCMPADEEPNQRLLLNIKKEKDIKFHFCAWIDPSDKNLDEFIDKEVNNIKFFKIHPSFLRKRVTDESLTKYLDIALDNRIPVIVHCGRWQEIASFEYPLEIAKKYKKLQIILAHLGGDVPLICLECASKIKLGKYKNIYLGTESVREFYFVKKVIDAVGADKIIFGSDYNLCFPGTFITIIENLNISKEEKELIFYKNITRLIKKDF